MKKGEIREDLALWWLKKHCAEVSWREYVIFVFHIVSLGGYVDYKE